MAVDREDYSEEGVTVLTPTEPTLTADVVQELRTCIDAMLTGHVIIDFRTIRFLVSGSLYPHAEPITPLLKLHKQMLAEARQLVLCNLGSEIAEAFRITRLDQVFAIRPDLAAAKTAVCQD